MLTRPTTPPVTCESHIIPWGVHTGCPARCVLCRYCSARKWCVRKAARFHETRSLSAMYECKCSRNAACIRPKTRWICTTCTEPCVQLPSKKHLSQGLHYSLRLQQRPSYGILTLQQTSPHIRIEGCRCIPQRRPACRYMMMSILRICSFVDLLDNANM